jgi:hypothetical protein
MQTVSISTHDVFLKPFRSSFQTENPEPLPSGFSPFFPPLPASSFPTHLREKLMQDNENVKQYWIPKGNEEKENNDKSSSAAPFLSEEQKNAMWVGASRSDKNSASDSASFDDMKPPKEFLSQVFLRQPGTMQRMNSNQAFQQKQQMGPPDSDSESSYDDYGDDSGDEVPSKNKFAKKPKRRMIYQLS